MHPICLHTKPTCTNADFRSGPRPAYKHTSGPSFVASFRQFLPPIDVGLPKFPHPSTPPFPQICHQEERSHLVLASLVCLPIVKMCTVALSRAQVIRGKEALDLRPALRHKAPTAPPEGPSSYPSPIPHWPFIIHLLQMCRQAEFQRQTE